MYRLDALQMTIDILCWSSERRTRSLRGSRGVQVSFRLKLASGYLQGGYSLHDLSEHPRHLPTVSII